MTMRTEEHPSDSGARVTEADLADLRSENVIEILQFRNEMLQFQNKLTLKIAEVQTAVAGIDGQMKWIFALLTAILVAFVGMFFKEILLGK